MQQDEVLHDGQTQACSALRAGGRGIKLFKGLEYPGAVSLGDPGAAVLHGNLDTPVQRFRRDHHWPAGGKFECVVQQVQQDLLQPVLVGRHEKPFGNGDFDARCGIPRPEVQERGDLTGHLAQIQRSGAQIRPAGPQAGEIQNFADQMFQPATRGHDKVQRLDCRLRQGAAGTLCQRFGQADDPVQGRTQLVAGIGEEFILQARKTLQLFGGAAFGVEGVFLPGVKPGVDQ